MKFVAILDRQEIMRYALKKLIQEVSTEQVYFEEIERESELILFLERFPKGSIFIDYHFLLNTIELKKFIAWQEQFPLINWTLVFEEGGIEVDRHMLNMDGTYLSVIAKNYNLRKLKEGLRVILRGDVFQSSEVKAMFHKQRKLVDEVDEQLTKVEREILKEISLGRMTKEIAFDRSISVHTVVTHRKNIFKKLGVNSVHDAIRFAIRSGIVSVNEYII